MIVCARCGHENPEGRNLCGTCRAYLGWARRPDAAATEAPPETSPQVPTGTTTPAADGIPTPVAPQHVSSPPPPPPPATPPSAPPAAAAPALPVAAPAPPPGSPPAAPQYEEYRPAASSPRAPGGAGTTGVPYTPRARPEAVTPGRPTAPTGPRQVTPGYADQAIPTRIAETPARHVPAPPPEHQRAQPSGAHPMDAIRPDQDLGSPARPGTGAQTRSSALPPTGHGLLADPGGGVERRCPQCRSPLADGARFCRCGAVLVRPAPPVEEPLDVRPPWHRRLRGGSGRSFWASARAANSGVRTKFDAAQSLKGRAMQYTAILGVVGISASQLGPWGADLRTTAWERASAFLPLSFTSLEADTAVTDPVLDPATPGTTPPEGTIDLDTGVAWITTWATPDPQGQPCFRQPGAVRLVVGFTEPVRVDRVSIAAGLPDGAFDRVQENRPRRVDVLLSDGTCETLDLDDAPGLQSLEAEGRGVTSVTLSVVDVYPGESTTESLVALTEVVVEHR